MNSLTLVYTLVVAAANATVIVAFLRGYRSRRSDRVQKVADEISRHSEQVQAIQANTTATADLTKRFDVLASTLQDHDRRIWKMEWTADQAQHKPDGPGRR